jgi:hypothetical protein
VDEVWGRLRCPAALHFNLTLRYHGRMAACAVLASLEFQKRQLLDQWKGMHTAKGIGYFNVHVIGVAYIVVTLISMKPPLQSAVPHSLANVTPLMQ